MRRTGLIAVLLLSLTAAGTLGVGPSHASPAKAQAQPRWSVQTSPTMETLADVSCASASQCFAVGTNATIVKTMNGGQTWKSVPTLYGSDNPTASFISVRCPVPGVCSVLAAPNVILRTVDGGRSWRKHIITLPPRLAGLGRLACPTRNVCFVTAPPSGDTFSWFTHSSAIFKTSDGGASWRRLAIPRRTLCPGDCGPAHATVGYDLEWISCQSARSCRAGGVTFIGSHEGFASAVIRTDDGGVTWLMVHKSFDVSAGTCPTTSICTGVFYQPLSPNTSVILERTTDGGTSWITRTVHPVLTAIACTGKNFCELAGPKGTLAMAIDTRLFKQFSPTGQNLNAVACPRMTACYAVGVGGTIVARRK